MTYNGAHISLAGIATLLAMSGWGSGLRKDTTVKYRSFCGPTYPVSRQHRRQLQRQADAAVQRLTVQA